MVLVMHVRAVSLSWKYTKSGFMLLSLFSYYIAAALGLGSKFLRVNEDAKEAQICFFIESLLNNCPVPFPFEIYFSTFNSTAGTFYSGWTLPNLLSCTHLICHQCTHMHEDYGRCHTAC